MRDPIKLKEWKARRARQHRIEKYGIEFADVCMMGRHGRHARGPRNGRWNGGVLKSSHGYVLRRVSKSHHRAFGPTGSAHRYAYEHDLVVEQHIKRRLNDNEVVHHKNGLRDDNRIENLEVTTRSNHAREHASLPWVRDGFGRFNNEPRHPKGGDPAEWPIDLRVQQYPTTIEDTLDRFTAKGTVAWADVPDAAQWVRELRGETK